jgi:hypothetical protein
MATLPELTQKIDDAFLSTWYKIQPVAIDNILDANVITAALRAAGCFESRTGGTMITETLRYGTKTASEYAKGDTLPTGEDDLETMGWWNWKYIVTHVQRTLVDDQTNAGPDKIKDYVATRLGAARDALNDKIESVLMAEPDTAGGTDLRGDKAVNSLYNLLPSVTGTDYQTASYVFGNVSFGNSWWAGKYKTATADPDTNLLTDMRNLYNTISANIAPPKLLITDQNVFELYEDFALDKVQIVQDETTHLANLGFEALRFKGKPLIWSSKSYLDGSGYSSMLMLNTDFIRIVYDPNYWFQMSDWEKATRQFERVAYIVLTCNLVCNQLRRQGVLRQINLG